MSIFRKEIKGHTWIELSKDALLHNYDYFAQELKKTKSLFVPIVKGDAYGHGLEVVYEILKERQPLWLGVNEWREAQTLRVLGFSGRILLMGPLLPYDLPQISNLDCDIFLSNVDMLLAWKALDENSQKRVKLHLKVDTGLSRQGFSLKDIPFVLEALKEKQELVVGLCSHFANVEDVSSLEYPKKQLKTLLEAENLLQGIGFLDVLVHISSSASSLILPESRRQLCRVGISLYGFWPSSLTRLSFKTTQGAYSPLKPVLSWKSTLIQVRKIEAKTAIGYGCAYQSFHPMTIGVVACGYYEGYPRLAANKGSYVLIQGIPCPILGRLCMNMMIVDVSQVLEPKTGDQVILIGCDQEKEEQITAEQVAQWAETIHYEILTRLPTHVSRILV